MEAKAGDGDLTIKFPFENKGTTSVDIRRIEGSCSCVSGSVPQQHINPGEKGEIAVRYTVGDHTGRQEHTVAVTTSDSATPTVLTLIVHIPEVLQLHPVSLTWSLGEKNTPKTITVETTQNLVVTNFTVQSSNTLLPAEAHTVAEGRKYEITVTPTQTGRPLFANLSIHCRVADTDKSFHTTASVRPAPPLPRSHPSPPPASPSPTP